MAKKVAKKAAKKAAPKKGNKFNQMVQASKTLERLSELLNEVKNSKSSVFAKDDVLKIISEVRESFKLEEPSVDLESFIDDVAENIADNITESDLDDVDMSMQGCEVFIDNLKLDESRVRELVEEIVTGYFD
jgi:hypothetical protein